MAWLIRSVAIAGVSLIACLGAEASDLPSSGPAPAPFPGPATPTGDNWSGPWIGVYGGWGFASPNGSFSVTGDPNDITPAISSQVDGSGAGSISAKGALGGVQGGWNLRLNTDYVVGVEADVGYGDLKGARSSGGVIPSYSAPYTVSQNFSTGWQAALRARVGYLVNPATLAFFEVGPAFGSFHYGAGFADYVPIANYSEFENASASAVKVGLTLGGGVEYMLGPNVSVRAEYLYTRYPSVNMSGTSNTLIPVPSPGYVAHSSGAINQNTFKIGVNYLLR